jgi:hypothetical protein
MSDLLLATTNHLQHTWCSVFLVAIFVYDLLWHIFIVFIVILDILNVAFLIFFFLLASADEWRSAHDRPSSEFCEVLHRLVQRRLRDRRQVDRNDSAIMGAFDASSCDSLTSSPQNLGQCKAQRLTHPQATQQAPPPACAFSLTWQAIFKRPNDIRQSRQWLRSKEHCKESGS